MFRSSPPRLRWLVPAVLPALLAAFVPFSSAIADVWFGDPVITPVERRQIGLRVADLDQDGRDEVISNTTAGIYVVYRADATGLLSVSQTLPGALWGGFEPIDDDRDGFPDLVAQDAGGSFRIWRNDGAGQWIDSGFTVPAHSSLVAVGKLTGDVYPDLLVRGEETDELWIHLGTEAGLFAGTDTVRMRLPEETPGTFGINDAVLFDLNLDSVPDLFVSGILRAWMPSLRWRLGGIDGSFGPLRLYEPAVQMSEYNIFDVHDMNGDGDPEIAVMWVGFEGGNTPIYTYRGATDGLQYLCTAPGYGVPTIEPLDGDNLADLIMSDFGTMTVHRYLGGGSFQTIQSFPGETPVLARILGSPARDLVYARRDPNQIHVCQSLVAPASAEEPAIDRGRLRLVAWPSVAVRDVRLGLRGALTSLPGASGTIEIFDVAGRRVRAIDLAGGNDAVWDLSTETGSAAPPGVYLLRARTGRGIATGRVHVIR